MSRSVRRAVAVGAVLSRFLATSAAYFALSAAQTALSLPPRENFAGKPSVGNKAVGVEQASVKRPAKFPLGSI